MNTIERLILTVALTAAVPLTVFAAGDSGNMAGMDGMSDMSGMKGMTKARPAQEALSQGEVRKVDAEQAKITIKHGPLENLGMPGMTMIFRVSDRALLDNIKSGDAIRFRAEKIDGAYTVTHLEKKDEA